MKYYKENINVLIDEIFKKYPQRKNIIYEGYQAHLNKIFYSSIIIFLTQIDGISNELMSKNFFQKREWQKLNLNDDIKSKVAYFFLKSYFDDYNNEAPIKHSLGKRKNWKTSYINRHQVLHGEILDFNTEENSLKVFSLLVSLAENLEWIKNNCIDL